MLTVYLIVMRRLKISYPTALSLAQESRSLICPNEGFQRQLQIWEQCNLDVYMPSTAGETEKKEKPAYKAWKDERDSLLRGGEDVVNRARTSAMASMAARFGKRRQEALGHSPNP